MRVSVKITAIIIITAITASNMDSMNNAKGSSIAPAIPPKKAIIILPVEISAIIKPMINPIISIPINI